MIQGIISWSKIEIIQLLEATACEQSFPGYIHCKYLIINYIYICHLSMDIPSGKSAYKNIAMNISLLIRYCPGSTNAALYQGLMQVIRDPRSMKVLNEARLKQQMVKNTAEVQGMCFLPFQLQKKMRCLWYFVKI